MDGLQGQNGEPADTDRGNRHCPCDFPKRRPANAVLHIRRLIRRRVAGETV